ncbi:hypothetical protein MJO28_012160 [Puccinia striiformis f. sp. tritici]|uniref:Uncharacterized protein n=1 Tax=Puccinia striiformis f. sp. tritici TaxID=168172 RepID=A0ACC0E126_9BASI|nr:hypothetical protein MJO28_012160 [Puccinia striiformis f. sp. tritici]
MKFLFGLILLMNISQLALTASIFSLAAYGRSWASLRAADLSDEFFGDAREADSAVPLIREKSETTRNPIDGVDTLSFRGDIVAPVPKPLSANTERAA